MRGGFIGIMANESAALLKGLLGILKSGNGFVPINPTFPKERIDFIINDCNIKVLLTDRTNEDKAAQVVRDNPRVEQLICIDQLGEIEKTDPRLPEECCVIPGDQPCYLIYTSGSTGKPKGVPITLTNVTPLFLWFRDYFLLGEHTKILQTLSYTFDFGVFELLTTLIFGGTIYFLNMEEMYDLNGYVDFITEHGINTIHATPSFFSSIVSVGRKMPTLKLVHLGGEKLAVKTVEDISQLLEGDYRIYNGYGPTEATINVSIFAVTPDPEVKQYIKKIDTVPIGKPSANNVIYILDKRNRLLPVGIPGEICIGGGGVARGYLNRPELTAEKFLNKSFVGGQFYKTGDLGRWLPDGNIQYIGRIDDQVKVRGFRIELGEIENCLLSHKKIKDTAVVVREDRQGDKYLCAYYVPAVFVGDINGTVLREYLADRLPDYMVPSFFVQMEKMPLSSSGKINRKALPEPMVTGDMGHVAPQNELEERLQKIWQEIFEQESIGIYDDFFEIGGHSLKAIQLISIIHRECSVKIPLDVLFKSPTIKELAEYIQGAAKKTFLAIPLVEEKEYYPLSSAQERLYVLQQMELDGIAYNIPQFYILDGRLDSEKLGQAFQQLITRHESLRTSFQMINQKPVQRIHPEVPFSIEYNEKDEINHFVRPFDLSRAPLLRVGLIKTGGTEHLLMVDIHHIITDGTSMDLFISDLMAIYAGKELPALKLRYKDYSEWQNSEQQVQSEEIRQQEAFWLKQFEEEVPVLHLPTDYARPAVQSFEGSMLSFQMPVEHTGALNQMALDTGTTLYMVVLAIYYIFLYRLSGQEDIVVGTPVEARRSVELERIIGMFVNMLPLRNFPMGSHTFKGFLRELKTRTLEAFENQEFQFEDLVERVSINRDVSRNPLFDVTFTLAKLEVQVGDMSLMAGGAIEVPQLSIKPYETEEIYQIAKFDLHLTCLDKGKGEGLFCILGYCTRLFKKETIQRFAVYLEKVVLSIVENPDVRLSGIEIISREEKQEILYTFNDTGELYPTDRTIPQLFESQVEQNQDNIALVGSVGTRFIASETITMTYKELDKISNQLAHHLLQQGVRKNEIVGLMSDRSVEMIIGILGILKAGGAYVPLNPKAPAARSRYLLAECGARILMSKVSEVSVSEDIEVIDLVNIGPIRPIGPIVHGLSTDLCYVIFTSGSTGKPKGVPIRYSNLSPLLHWGYRHLGLGSKDRFIQNLSYYFDWSVWEISIAITTGACLHMVPDELLLNSGACIDYMNRDGITVLHVTPTQYHYFVNVGRKLETLKYLFIGAEKFSRELLQRSFESVNEDCRVFNMYGPTECTIISAVLEIDRLDVENNRFENLSSVPIGGPVANIDLLVLDKYLNLCPVNVPGELYIAGDCVAHGYLNNPELTVEKFFSFSLLSFSASQLLRSPLYRTGDRVRWLADPAARGAYIIEFLGRIDQQVKIRGFRIELGEIESHLLKHPLIKEAVVIEREKEDGETYLYSYVITKEDFDLLELKEYLSKSLPNYMIPSYFMKLESIPLNVNGKLDRRALPEPGEADGAAEGIIAPGNEVEKKLIALWSEVLDIDENIIGIDSNFFHLGGHSLKATVLVSEINREFMSRMPLVQMFTTPTIRQLAAHLSELTGESAALADNQLVRLRKGSNHRYLFLVHDGSGEVEGYIEFCRRLAVDIDCWGIRAQKFPGYHPHNLCFEEIAGTYIEKIKKVQPLGPYHIAGWSLGGTIAFEMVRQLEGGGETVTFFALVDTLPPKKDLPRPVGEFTIPSELEWLSKFIGSEEIVDLGAKAGSLETFWLSVVKALEQQGANVENMRRQVPEYVSRVIPNFDRLTRQELIYHYNVTRTFSRAFDQYMPEGKIKTAVHFFAAGRTHIEEEKKWQEYSDNPVEFYEISGDHFSILKSPEVEALAKRFENLIDQDIT